MERDVHELFKKLGLTLDKPPDVTETIRRVQVHPRVLQDFRPLCESLEWQLSEVYWKTAGLRGFLANEVPYTVNNSGSLSELAAALLFTSCLESPPAARFAILEIGAGSALFARYLLDEFRDLCRTRGKNYYDELTFYVTDGSPRTVEQWAGFGLFADHAGHVVTAVCDATSPEGILPGDGLPLRAVFANYVLDSLPASIVRKGGAGAEQQYIRTHLTDAARVAQQTRLTLDEIRAMAASGDPAELAKLIPLVGLLEFEVEFQPVNGSFPWADEAITFAHNLERVVLNHGAFRSLEKLLQLISDDGFVLLNDYGAISFDQITAQAGSQRFGSSAAIGLNFPLLDHHFSTRAIHVVAPERDDLLSVHPRLMTRRELSQTQAAFLKLFDGSAQRAIDECEQQARSHVEAGRFDRAKEAFEQALSKRPRDWRLIGEMAEFVIRQVGDYEAGLQLAHAGLAVNPWTSVWLWNILGDALFSLERYPEAHQAYEEAARIEPNDVRTALNLAYSHAQFGDFEAALSAISKGLAQDVTGLYRSRLLEKQQHILTLVSQRAGAEKEWQARRMERLAQ